jgi:hypothetical protein
MPVIGIVQVGYQSMADRYTYIPLIGIFIMIAYSMDNISSGWRNRKFILGSIAGITLIALSFVTQAEVRYWRSSEILFCACAKY